MQKIERKTESELLLNLKDINKFKEETINNKIDQKRIDIEESLEKYNTNVKKALNAPVPNIGLHYNEVLLRAVPAEIKSKGNLIISTGDTDLNIGNKLNTMSESVDQTQEILMVGNLITEIEKDAGIRPGRRAKIKLDNFRRLHDMHSPGMIETEYHMPIEIINGYKYMIVDKRDLLYTID